MGVVWESYGKGLPILGFPENSIDDNPLAGGIGGGVLLGFHLSEFTGAFPYSWLSFFSEFVVWVVENLSSWLVHILKVSSQIFLKAY